MLGIERRLARLGFKAIAGVDESGRGPLAGPVVACAVILSNTGFKNKIRDCKQLGESARLKAYDELISSCEYGIGAVSEKLIDDINILRASELAMMLAVLNLPRRSDYLIVDGKNMRLGRSFKYESIKEADKKSLSVAAASIIAKVTRDRIMKEYDERIEGYGFARHKGYGTSVHMRMINEKGPSRLHRLSFGPIKAVLAQTGSLR
jgi:ribonuclease HII